MAPSSPFRSWFMGGFEASTMSFAAGPAQPAGRVVDGSGGSGRLAHAAQDYALAAAHGLQSLRDGLSWARIEPSPGRYDWSSFVASLAAARTAGVQVAWDLCHLGVPDHVDLFSADFPARFAAYASAAARVYAEQSDEPPIWCPINEISYWAWAGGEHGHFAPYASARGGELKRQLVRAAIAASEAVRAVDARARLLAIDPILHTVDRAGPSPASEAEREAMFEAWDMICGRRDPELGGRPEHLDIVGVNYYATNQWFFDEGRTPIPPDHPAHRPPSDILLDVWRRYRRPMLVSETGAEGSAGPAWLAHVAAEVDLARARGADIQGICLYPVMDYPGWTDGRHCRCGLIEIAPGWGERRINAPMAEALAVLRRAHAGDEDRHRPKRTNWLSRVFPTPAPSPDQVDRTKPEL